MGKGASTAWRLLALVGALLLLWAGERLIRLPEPRAATPNAFSAERAKARLGRVLGPQAPHPVDSAGNDAVRARLMAELHAVGLRPVVDDGWSCNGFAQLAALSCARVRNVRATVGPTAGRHLLVVSHYDSTSVGPGAADDGIGIATMLETAALLARRPLARPITFLFNEGEEAALLGARAFLQRDPLASQVDALLNLEARGVEGPAIMFETSQPNGPAVAWLDRAVNRTVANSLATDFYRLIPNSTDVRIFSERPWTILNFAIIGNETRYHSPGDTLDALDPRSVQHMGEQTLSLATAYAAGGAPRGAGAQVFADIFGLQLVRMPSWLGTAGLALAGLLLAVSAWRARAWRGLVAALGAIVGAGLVAWIAMLALGALRPGEWWRGQPDTTSLALIATGLLAAVPFAAWALRGGRAGARAGAWLLFILLGAAATAVAPGASIFFVFPALLAGLGLVAGERIARWLLPAASALLVVTWAPLVGLLEVLLDFDLGWVFAGLYALLLVPVVVEIGRAVPVSAVGALAALGWACVALLPAYSADRKQLFILNYVLDGAGARWAVANDGAPLPARLTALASFARPAPAFWSTRPRRSAPAPGGLTPSPVMERIGAASAPGRRSVRLRLRTAGAESISLHAPFGTIAAVIGPTTRLDLAEPPHPLVATSVPAFFRCQGRSCDGVEVTIEVTGGAPVPITAVTSRPGLPAAAAPLLATRPANAAPQYSPDATVAIARLAI